MLLDITLTNFQFGILLFCLIFLFICLVIKCIKEDIESEYKKKDILNHKFDFSHCKECTSYKEDGFGYGDCIHDFKETCPYNKPKY